MSLQLNRRRRAAATKPTWSGVAFIIESMLLVVFLIASLSVFTQLFSSAVNNAEHSRSITAAVALASNSAERFAADPEEEAGETVSGNMRVVCDVTSEDRPAGTLYHATISVYNGPVAEPVYTIQTARYVSGVK